MQGIFTKYHIIVSMLYIGLGLGALYWLPDAFSYANTTNMPAYGLMALSTFGLVGYIKMQKRGTHSSTPFRVDQVFVFFLFIVSFAVCEELLFRGVVQGVFLKDLSAITSVFVSSIIFGTAHIFNGVRSFSLRDLNWHFAFMAFLGGLPLGGLFVLTDSLLLPTILHGLFLIILKRGEFAWRM